MIQEKFGSVEVAKLELLLGLKEREASLIKFQKGSTILFGFLNFFTILFPKAKNVYLSN